jgi:uncharacterized membrane protein YuzA (DUF378 family)
MCTNCKECKNGKCGCLIATTVKVLLIIGGLNWGLIGAGMLAGSNTNMNLVNVFFGTTPALEAFVYLVVGIVAFVSILGCKCKKCKKGTCDSSCTKCKS